MWIFRGLKKEVVFAAIWPIFATIISIILNVNLLISVLIFYGIPSIVISFKIKNKVKKAFLFSLITIPMYILIESIGNYSSSWIVPTIFSFKIFGAAFEGVIWGFFAVYYSVMFYELFLDKHLTKKLYTKKLKYLISFILAIFAVFLFVFFGFPTFLDVPYAYLLIGLIFILFPIVLQIVNYGKTLSKVFVAGAYFFYFHFIYEIVALKMDWWMFPNEGQFLGWISIFRVNFPFEELFFFIMLGVLAVLSFFEFFDDDEK